MVKIPKINSKTLKAVQEMSKQRDADMKARYENMTPQQADYLRRLCDAE